MVSIWFKVRGTRSKRLIHFNKAGRYNHYVYKIKGFEEKHEHNEANFICSYFTLRFRILSVYGYLVKLILHMFLYSNFL